MTAAYMTLGCKVSQYETQAIRTLLEQRGYQTVPFDGVADVYIINSCTVTSTGDKKSRQMTHRARRNNPHAVVVLCGCYPQASPQAAAKVTEADIVTGTVNRRDIPALIDAFRQRGVRQVAVKADIRKECYEELWVDGLWEHTRAFVKIQDGCDNFCTYCMVPFARGNVRSRQPSAITEEVRRLTTNGYREVVLTGINLSAYGRNCGLTLADAVDAAVQGGAMRVRLGSLEPDLLTDRMIERLSSTKEFCRQFHISLQSGSDGVLRRMGRPYTSADYRDLVTRLRKAMPDCAVTTDIMVAFAGETEEEFAETLAFVKDIGFASAHIFIYSRRPGTVADTLPGQIDGETGKKRSKALFAAVEESRQAYLSSLDGRTLEVLVLEPASDGVHSLGLGKDGSELLLPLSPPGSLLSAVACYRDDRLFGETK